MPILNQYITSQISRVSIRSLSLRKIKNWYANLSPVRKSEPPYNHIAQIGDPILRRKADSVPYEFIKTKEIKFVVDHLRILLKKYNCAGLSAPQIGIPLRIFVMEFGPNRKKEFDSEVFKARKMCTVPFTAFINPEMKIINNTKICYPEACESVKGFAADVPRYSEIEIKGKHQVMKFLSSLKDRVLGYNENEENIIIKADGWTARIIQHEMDHLDGKLYTDVMDRKTLTCTCWQAVNERGGKVVLPFLPD